MQLIFPDSKTQKNLCTFRLGSTLLKQPNFAIQRNLAIL